MSGMNQTTAQPSKPECPPDENSIRNVTQRMEILLIQSSELKAQTELIVGAIYGIGVDEAKPDRPHFPESAVGNLLGFMYEIAANMNDVSEQLRRVE